MTFNETFVFQKIENIEGHLEKTKEIFDKFSNEEILGDFTKFHTAERLFQLAVDAMIDINHHIIIEKNLKVTDDTQGTFYTLGESNILPKDFAFKIAPIVGVRNRIVHGYEKLDNKLFITNFRNNFSDFEKYLEFIREFLKKKE